MKHTGRGEWSPELLDVFPGKGRTAEMPIGRVPGQSGDEDGNAGALHALACPQHSGDSGGRKLPPPMVRLVRHAIPLAGVEQATPWDSVVQQGGGTEEMTAGGGGDMGEYGAGLRGLQGTHQKCVGVHISGESADGKR